MEKDVGGNEIGSVVRTGRPDRGMPQFNLTDTDLAAIVAFLVATAVMVFSLLSAASAVWGS